LKREKPMKIPDSLIKQIKISDQRLTKQKELVLSVLVSNKDRMLSAQEIMNQIPKTESIDFATVYRNLNAFLEIGIVEQTVDMNGRGLYKIACEADAKNHHHFICLICGKVKAIPCDKRFIGDISEKYGFEESFHTLEIFGKCEECLKKE
jgi:Fe2+ or Zn2+ uptake regulation protein